ncbi:MAG: L,D-transpeptidase [Polyangiales bacterium]
MSLPHAHSRSPLPFRPCLRTGRGVSSIRRGLGLCGLAAVLVAGCGGEPAEGTDEPSVAETAGTEGEGSEPTTATEAASDAEDGGVEDGGADGGEATAGVPKRIFAGRFVVNVRVGAAETATRIGRLRAGAVLTAKTSSPVGYDDCPGGWYELSTGGFVCNRREVIAFDGDRLPEVRFRQPRMADPLPYEYGYIRSEVPVYRRPPTDAEAMEHEGWRPPRPEGEEEAAAGTVSGTARPDGGSGNAVAAGTAARPAGSTPAPAGEVAASGMQAAAAGNPAATPAGEGAPTMASARPAEAAVAAAGSAPAVPAAPAESEEPEAEEPAEPITLESLRGEGVVHHRAMRGFWVSLDRRIRSGPRRYWRTQNAGFVPARAVATREGSSFQGLALDETTTLPVGFISRRQGTNAETMDPERGRLRRARRAYHRDSFAIAREERVGNRDYYVTADGLYYRADQVMRVDRVEREERIPAGVKWVEVNLENQTLVAYDGDTPAYVTLISSGRVKRRGDEDHDHHTPSGVFRIREKHITNTMDGDGTVVDGPYSIEDVPYVQYFWRSYAFHTAFWHDNFGRTKSHGCVNMSPLDSRWLFNWTTPGLPTGWHSVWAPEDEEDTTPTYVWVHGETPLG